MVSSVLLAINGRDRPKVFPKEKTEHAMEGGLLDTACKPLGHIRAEEALEHGPILPSALCQVSLIR